MHVTCQVIESKGKDANSIDSNTSLPRHLLVDFIRCSLAEAAEIRDRGAAKETSGQDHAMSFVISTR